MNDQNPAEALPPGGLPPEEATDDLPEMVKTLDELLADRVGYLQRALQLEDEYKNMEEALPAKRDELNQIRGALAIIEVMIEDLTTKRNEQVKQKAEEKAKRKEEEKKKAEEAKKKKEEPK